MLQEIDPQGGQYSLEVTHLISDNTWYKPRTPDPKVQYITTKLCCLLSDTGLWEAKMNIFFHLTWGIAQNGVLSGVSHVNSPSPTLSAEVHSETPDSLPPAFSPWMSRRHLPLNMLRTALSSFPSKYSPVLSPRCRRIYPVTGLDASELYEILPLSCHPHSITMLCIFYLLNSFESISFSPSPPPLC